MDTVTFNVNEFELVELNPNEAEASVGLNPTFRWCKFVLTDDLPNANKHRIPEDEFDNIIRTGLYAPIKMAAGRIEDGHDYAIPLGTITSLKKSGNKILGLAALWSEERKDDVELIKKQYDEGNPVNLSWEVFYSDSVEEENGVKALRNASLRATTFVGRPAYQGRTQVLQVASTEENVELEQAQTKITELESTIANLQSELDSIKAEKEELASYKAGIESELAKVEKLQEIKNKFKEAGIEKDDQYFNDHSEQLLNMGQPEFDFMLQELVSFASAIKDAKASTAVPPIVSTNEKHSPKEIARKLRNLK